MWKIVLSRGKWRHVLPWLFLGGVLWIAPGAHLSPTSVKKDFRAGAPSIHFSSPRDPDSGNSPIVAQVGTWTLSQAALDRRTRFVKWQYPDADEPEMGALAQLIEGFLTAEVLAMLGRPVEERDLDEEAQRIDRSTWKPELLAEIKAIYAESRENYRRLHVLPLLANRRFYLELLPYDRDLHEPRRTLAADVLRRLRSSEISQIGASQECPEAHWETVFRSESGEFIGEEPEDGREPQRVSVAETANEVPEAERFHRWPEGEYFDRVVEGPRAFQILRWIGWKGTLRRGERLVIPKREASAIFWSLAKDVEVRIPDASLRDRFVQIVPWSSQIRFSR